MGEMQDMLRKAKPKKGIDLSTKKPAGSKSPPKPGPKASKGK